MPDGFAAPPGRARSPGAPGQAVLAAAGLVDDALRRDQCRRLLRRRLFRGARPVPVFRRNGRRAPRSTPSWPSACATPSPSTDRWRAAVCAIGGRRNAHPLTEVTGIDRAAEGGFRAPGPDGERRLTGDEPVSLNFWGFTPALFPLPARGLSRPSSPERGHDLRAEFFLPDAVNALMARRAGPGAGCSPPPASGSASPTRPTSPGWSERLREMTDARRVPAPAVGLSVDLAVAAIFAIDGDFVEAAPYGSGHIHDTFLAVYRNGPARVALHPPAAQPPRLPAHRTW